MHELTKRLKEHYEKGILYVWKDDDKIITDWLKEKAEIMKDNPTPLRLPAIQMILGIKEESLEDKVTSMFIDIYESLELSSKTKVRIKQFIELAKQHFKENPEELE